MNKTFIVITSIADECHPVLTKIAARAVSHQVPLIVIGDISSPKEFSLEGCEFYSLEDQGQLPFDLAEKLPVGHYSRKNLGYLKAIESGAEIIVETDDDNIPLATFWDERLIEAEAHLLEDTGWTNVYRYFADTNIWPRGFALEHLHEAIPKLSKTTLVKSPIQQGLADENPDVDAIYRLTRSLPVYFKMSKSIALGANSFCPFNSQNTTWFKEAFPLLYLPSYCSFRMTDIWRSFVAQRIAWTCGWPILFHNCTVRQERNVHNLMNDFKDEIPGYRNNDLILQSLKNLKLQDGLKNIPENLIVCYTKLVELEIIDPAELGLLETWLKDIASLLPVSQIS
ncbi:STELLO glycosyltransferase family protein [Pontibacter sp. HSC-14F20]|uniref:STELLO glycosyltransferase family protein n=1 Tax=Pontibacter sp. HSC-14F20 TaxID=2864136 RepID=UPI001C73A576|nr:STELLO glycosyltransferase family protein [Pontibacter sp. HSC-14F20]MBX0334492.1 STELLO glycosyltransferase family protein [Pontibacter sp. HSC-14F20]